MRLMMCVAASLVLVAADALALDDTPTQPSYVPDSALRHDDSRPAVHPKPEPLLASAQQAAAAHPALPPPRNAASARAVRRPPATQEGLPKELP